jgi:hypothetical protein
MADKVIARFIEAHLAIGIAADQKLGVGADRKLINLVCFAGMLMPKKNFQIHSPSPLS